MDTWDSLASACLDRLIDLFGVSWAIDFLLEYGFSKDFLVTLGFDEKDIEAEEEREKI